MRQEEDPMKTRSFEPARRLLIAGAMVAALTSVSAASAADPNAAAAGCVRQFEDAQRLDMESFRDFDAETFRAGHHPDSVTIFASGAVRYGIDAIMAALAPHFANRNAIWSWVEKHRIVDGCKSAFILYETWYEIPSIGFKQHALTGVTYTHEGDHWLSIADQGTLLQ